MRRVAGSLAGVALTLSGVGGSVSAGRAALAQADPDQDRRAVATLDTEYQAAVKRNDAAAMARILHEEFVLVTGNGTVVTREELLAEASRGEFSYERQDEDPGTQTVRVFGDTAVVTARLWLKGVRNGAPFDRRLWFSDTYVRTAGGWRYAFGQASLRLPDGVAASGSAESSATLAWFRATEQSLMDALAPGDRTVWERVMDASCVVTTEEGEVLPRERFLAELRPLPAGLSGRIVVRDLTVQEYPAFAIVRYFADESESVFGQSLAVGYRVTNGYRRDGGGWKLAASHLSVVTRDPPAQEVSRADWPGLTGAYRLLPEGWTLLVELRDEGLVAGRDTATLRPLIPLAPHSFVLAGSLGEWHFVVENGRALRIVNLRKFSPLVWTRVEPQVSSSTATVTAPATVGPPRAGSCPQHAIR
jgi:ketosteroid isomerase-like protein